MGRDYINAMSELKIPDSVKNDISDVCAELHDNFKDNIYKLILFGSYAKQNYQPDSDVDIAVVLNVLPPLKERREYIPVFEFDVEIDLLFCSREQLSGNSMIYRWINEQGVVLYEQL